MADRDYMDLVVVEIDGKCKLVQAPWCTRLDTDDKVVVSDGLSYEARVITSMSVRRDDDEELTFVKALAGLDDCDDIPRVIKRIKEYEVEYDD